MYEIWDEINEADRLLLIERLTKLESQLATISFPAYGSLYFRDSIVEESRRVLLESSIDPSSSYCVGPACDRHWPSGFNGELSQPELNTGPCQCLLVSIRAICSTLSSPLEI